MELAPVDTLGTITWRESDLNREALAFQRFILECIVPDSDWLDPGDRPDITLSIGGTSVYAQVACVSVSHDIVFMVVGIPVDSPVPPYPTHFLGFVKSRRSAWELHDQCAGLTEGDVQDVQSQADHALALLLSDTQS